jgi:hypothetical protein
MLAQSEITSFFSARAKMLTYLVENKLVRL